MSNLKKPSWFIDLKFQHTSGKFKKPSWFQDRNHSAGKRPFNPGGYRDADPPVANRFSAGLKVPGHMKTQDIAKPTGQFTTGSGYQDPGTPVDLNPHGNYYFSLEITDAKQKNTVVAHFQECSGLKNSTTPFEIEEGGQNHKAHKRPGQSKWENIVLKYASSASTFLLKWRDDWLTGTDYWKDRQKYSGSIVLINNNRKIVKRYSFKNAWPVSWEGPSFSSGDSSLAVETLELAHDGLVIEDDNTDYQP